MRTPFGHIEDGVWKLCWEERIAILEYFVTASGHETTDRAEDEFWEHVENSESRFLEKDFEEIPDEAWEKFEAWVSEEDE